MTEVLTPRRLAERLRACGNGAGSFKTDLGDFGLCDEAAAAIELLLAALQPFAEAAEDVPADVQDFKLVAYVPAGHNAEPFRKIKTKMTAGAFRAALAAYSEEGAS